MITSVLQEIEDHFKMVWMVSYSGFVALRRTHDQVMARRKRLRWKNGIHFTVNLQTFAVLHTLNSPHDKRRR